MAPTSTGSFFSVPDSFSPVLLFPRDFPLFLPNQYSAHPKTANTITPRGTPKPIPIFAGWLRLLGAWVDEVVAELPEGVTLVVEICVLFTVEPSGATIGGEVVEVVIGKTVDTGIFESGVIA